MISTVIVKFNNGYVTSNLTFGCWGRLLNIFQHNAKHQKLTWVYTGEAFAQPAYISFDLSSIFSLLLPFGHSIFVFSIWKEWATLCLCVLLPCSLLRALGSSKLSMLSLSKSSFTSGGINLDVFIIFFCSSDSFNELDEWFSLFLFRLLVVYDFLREV